MAVAVRKAVARFVRERPIRDGRELGVDLWSQLI